MQVVSQLNYEKVSIAHPQELMVQIQPINNVGGNTSGVALSNSAVYGPISFLINSRCLNLARSTIEYDLEIATTTSNYNWVQACAGAQISRMVLTGQSTNSVLCDISNLDRYATGVAPALTLNDTLLNSYSGLYTDSTTAIVPLSTTAATTPAVPVGVFSKANGIVNIDGLNQAYGPGYENKRNLFVGSATTGTDRLSVIMKLGDLAPLSCLALDKVIYYAGENLMLDVYFNQVNRFAWIGTSNTNPLTGAAAASTCTLKNLKMKISTEQNSEIISELVNRVNGPGMELQFAYPICYKSNLSGTSQSATLNLSRGFGERLLAVCSVPYNNTESLNSAQDHSIPTLINSSTSGTLQTYMDSVPIQTNNPASIFNGDLYLYNKNKLRHSIIKASAQYNIDFVQIDSFVRDALCQVDMTNVDGFDLSTNHQYSFELSLSASSTLNWYIFLICQKRLLLGSQGMQIA